MRGPAVAIAALTAWLGAAAGARAQDTLTLDEAIRFALAHNRSVANTALQVEKAGHDVATARSRRLPQFLVEAQASQLLRPIDITFPRGAFGTFENIGPVPGADATITTPSRMSLISTFQASQPLTPLIKLTLNVKMSEAAQAKAREQLRDGELALIGEVRRAYYDLVQAQSALDANARSLDLLHELDRVVAARLVQQTALKADALATTAKLAKAEEARVEIESNISTRKEQLNQLMGRDVRTPFDVTGMPEAIIPAASLELAQARAVDARPDVRQARANLQQAEIARRIARADYLPDVSVTASMVTPANIEGAPNHIATAALQMRWEPFDWGRKERALASRDLEIRQAQNTVREVEDRAAIEVSARYRAVETARARLRAARADRDAAHESVRVRLMQYGTRAALFADVLQAQSAAADADSQLQQALAAFWSAQADFERAIAEGVEP